MGVTKVVLHFITVLMSLNETVEDVMAPHAWRLTETSTGAEGLDLHAPD